jgi:hypothetical protein
MTYHRSTLEQSFYLLLDGTRVEVRVSGECVYPELLADAEFQAVKQRELTNGKNSRWVGRPGGFFSLQ